MQILTTLKQEKPDDVVETSEATEVLKTEKTEEPGNGGEASTEVNQEPVDQEPVDQEPVDQEPVEGEPVEEEEVQPEPEPEPELILRRLQSPTDLCVFLTAVLPEQTTIKRGSVQVSHAAYGLGEYSSLYQ